MTGPDLEPAAYDVPWAIAHGCMRAAETRLVHHERYVMALAIVTEKVKVTYARSKLTPKR